jgi:hypothetical protein
LPADHISSMWCKARIFSSCSSVQPEARVCGGPGQLQINRSGYIL